MVGAGTVVAAVLPDTASDGVGNPSSAPAGNAVVNFNAAGRLQFSAPIFDATEGTASVLITLSRFNGSDEAVSVTYGTADGTATGADYTAVSGTLSWGAGDTGDKTFSVPLTTDTLSEGGESFLYHTKLQALTVRSPVFAFDPAGPVEQDMPASDFYVKKS